MITLSQRESTWVIVFICISILSLGTLWLVTPQYKNFIQQSQKSASLQSASETLNQQKASMIQDINRYKFLINDSRKKVGYTFSDENPEQRIKGFLRELLSMSSSTGNELVSILPSQTNEKVSIKTTSLEEAPLTEGEPATEADKNTAAKTEETKESQQRFVAVKEKSLPLSTTNMDMQIRGSYQSVLGFVGALAKHNALLKVESFQLKYEAVDIYASSQGNGALGFNAEKPIRLTLKIKLYLLEAGFKP